MKSPSIIALVREAKPGTCPLCDGPLPGPKWRKYCRSRDCKRLYVQLYAADRRARERKRNPIRPVEAC